MKHAAKAGTVFALIAVPIALCATGTPAIEPDLTLPPIASELRDDFDQALDPQRWQSWGQPSPTTETTRQGRDGIFDNGGDGAWESGIDSVALVETRGGFVLECEVFLEMTNPAGCWLVSRLALTGDPNDRADELGRGLEKPAAVVMALGYDGDACWATEPEQTRKGWLHCGYDAASGRVEGMELDATPWLNRWVNLRIEVDAERRVSFWLDGQRVWAPSTPLAERCAGLQRVRVCGRSRGSAGKAWVDWVAFRQTGNVAQ